jgi:hypothetical protein
MVALARMNKAGTGKEAELGQETRKGGSRARSLNWRSGRDPVYSAGNGAAKRLWPETPFNPVRLRPRNLARVKARMFDG